MRANTPCRLPPILLSLGSIQECVKGFAVTFFCVFQVAIESIENMRTVASLTKEEKFYDDYCEMTLKPYKYVTRAGMHTHTHTHTLTHTRTHTQV